MKKKIFFFYKCTASLLSLSDDEVVKLSMKMHMRMSWFLSLDRMHQQTAYENDEEILTNEEKKNQRNNHYTFIHTLMKGSQVEYVGIEDFFFSRFLCRCLFSSGFFRSLVLFRTSFEIIIYQLCVLDYYVLYTQAVPMQACVEPYSFFFFLLSISYITMCACDAKWLLMLFNLNWNLILVCMIYSNACEFVADDDDDDVCGREREIVSKTLSWNVEF